MTFQMKPPLKLLALGSLQKAVLRKESEVILSLFYSLGNLPAVGLHVVVCSVSK